MEETKNVLRSVETTIFEKEYRGSEEFHKLKADVMDMWSVRRNPLVRMMPEELTHEKFKGILKVKITCVRRVWKKEGGIKVGDQVKMVGCDSPLLTVRGIGVNHHLCEWYVNDKRCWGWFGKDSIIVAC